MKRKGISQTFLKRAKQQRLPFEPIEMIPASVVVIKTDDLDLSSEAGCEAVLRRMFDVPMEKSILLDYLVGYKRGDMHPSENHVELHRLQSLLNSRYHGRRFNFLGDSLTARLFRESIRTEGWNPFKDRDKVIELRVK
jgi:hypothetical protein